MSHESIPELKDQYLKGKMSRREFPAAGAGWGADAARAPGAGRRVPQGHARRAGHARYGWTYTATH